MSNSQKSRHSRTVRNVITTKSGKTIKVHRTMADRAKARKSGLAAVKATYLSTLPKGKLKRILYRLHPKRVARYWFSRKGAIMALKITGIAIILVFFLTIGLFAYFRKDLPKIKDVSDTKLGGSITYYDRTGKTVLWQDYDAVKRLPVPTTQMSPFIRQATIAIEDKDFYKHGAFDVRGIMRAGVHDVFGGGGAVQGGSSITQQLVKLNENWTDNRTIARKVKELILAVELERENSKEDILTGYLNIAPYGGVEYGVESAARDYFHISAKELTLAQATMLAAIPQAPRDYSPYSSPVYNPGATTNNFIKNALLNRQHYILDKMVAQHYITTKQAKDAKLVDVLAQVHPQVPKYDGIKAPYFVLAAKQELQQMRGVAAVQRGGWKITTTLDIDLQNKAEELVASNLANVTRYGADEEAVVGEDVQTGQIVSLVGGTDFGNADHGQNNFAAGILIPPGSSFKPYDYAALIEHNNNVGAGSVLYDTQSALPGYPCTNKALPKNGGNCLEDYDFIYPGPLTLRYALGGSRNVPAIKAMLSADPTDKSTDRAQSVNKVIGTASAMMSNTYDQAHHKSSYNCYGDEALTQTTQCYGASAIGDGAFLHLDDHVNGLSTLSRLGNAIPRTYILNINDSGDKNLYKWVAPKGKQVIRPDAAYIVNDMASDYRASYLPGNCSETSCTGYKFHRYNGWKFAVKTGTTNDGYDGLMTSWSGKYAFVSWVGNHTRHVTLRTSMENLTEPLTRGWMEYAHKDIATPTNWVQPSGIKSSAAFVVRNHIHFGDIEPSPTNDLYPSWYAGGASKTNTSQTLDKVSGKVATSCTPELAKDVQYNSNVASWNIDIYAGGHTSVGSTSSSNNGSAQPTDDVHNCSDSHPSITLTAPATCESSCTITATVSQGTHPLSDDQRSQFPGNVTFTMGGQTLHTQNVSDSPSTVSFTYTPTTSGSDTLNAYVTDSVLYQGSDSATLNYTIPPPPPTPVAQTLTLNLLSHAGTTANFSWNAITGATSYHLCLTGASTACKDFTTTSGAMNTLIPNSKYGAIVTANDTSNTTSNEVTWKQ